MSVHQTKDGRWFAAYREAGASKVRRRYFGRGADGKIEAKKWEAGFLAEAGRPSPKAPKRPALTYAQLAQKYLDARPLTSSTRSALVYTLNRHILPLFGRKHIEALTMADLSELDDTLAKSGLALATRNRIRAYCKAICGWGLKNELIPANPFGRFQVEAKKEGRAPDLMTEDELKALYEASYPHLKWIIEVMLNTGVRPGATELFALKMADVDFAAGGVWVTRRKTNSPRALLPLQADFLAKVQALAAAEPGRVWLIEYDGRQVGSLKTAWRAALRRAGITRRLRPYDLRHWYGSSLLRAGADLKAVSELMGHSSPNLTISTYYHLVEGQKRAALGHLHVPALGSK
jgi:integrase